MVHDSEPGGLFGKSFEQLETTADNLGSSAVADTIGAAPVAMYGPMPSPPAPTAEKIAETARIEAIRVLDKDAFKLGDLNPLVHPVDLGRNESVDAISYTALEKIRENDGLVPTIMESAVVYDPEAGKAELRFIARFEVPSLTKEQIILLEELVRDTYGNAARTRTDSKGNPIPIQTYPPTQPGEEMKAKTGGWYMGPAPFPTSPLQQGLFLFKDLGPIDENNFLDDNQTARKFIVEVREAGQYQTDLVTFITQVAVIVGKGELPNRGQLLYETYYDLIRLGLKKAEEESIYGMDDATDMIRRELIIPLANPEISGSIKEDPQSVLMIGVPGTGKTLIVERLLQEETGLFILPIDPFELQKEVAKPKEKQTLMPRIAEIARITGKRVVLHVDDIENMVGEHEATNSTMLNLMAGVQESGFYIIASTNYPEKINASLIQPQRFSVLIHCGLQNEEARYEILKIHADAESGNLEVPLFGSDAVRDIILHEVAKHTQYFTPRYLANIATIAKSYLLDRVARTTGKTVGLTEADLQGHTFGLEDWDRAYAEVAAKYDSNAVKTRDDQLAAFVRKHSSANIGFASEPIEHKKIFARQIYDAVAALDSEVRVQLEQESET